MTLLRNTDRLRYHAPVLVCLLLVLLLVLLPTGFEDAVIYKGADRCAARVLSVDNSSIIDTGLIRSGEQTCTLELLGGRFEGRTVEAQNLLNGSLEQDKIFSPGDRALVVISYQGDEILLVTMTDHYRLDKEAWLALAFALLLILFAGRTGVRAILSFVLTVLTLWKVLVPLYLKGLSPIWVGLAVTLFLTVLIIALVYGFDRRCASAVSGATLGVLVTAALGCLCTDLFQIHGAVMPNSESLLYSGYQDLNLTRIFMASIFIGSSGAVMDLSVDITSAVKEVVDKKPGMGWAFRYERGPGRHGDHDHHSAAGLFRRICGAADGFHGPGHSCMEHFELQVCGLGDHRYHCGLLRSGDRGPVYSRYQRIFAHAGKIPSIKKQLPPSPGERAHPEDSGIFIGRAVWFRPIPLPQPILAEILLWITPHPAII